MKTTLVLFGFFLALVQCHVSVHKRAGLHLFKKRPVHPRVKTLLKPEPKPGKKHDCKPTDACVVNGGYCIQSKKKEDCNGLFFPKGCKSALFSCCVEDKCHSNPCGPNSHCKSTPGSYECICDAGYEKVNRNCVDINECDSSNNACLSNEDCTNVPGSYTCTNKCESNPCGPNSQCQTTPGSYECVCDAGYENVNGNCVDINECDTGNNSCPSNQYCTNVPGNYTCTNRCGPGLTYLPVNDRCGKLLSGNMTYEEGRAMCFKISIYEGDVNSYEEINAYGEAFLPNVGDIAWIHSVPFSVLDKCETLKKANSTFYKIVNLDCNVKMNAIICDSVGGM